MHYDNGDEIVEISDDEDDLKHNAQNATAYNVPAGPGLEEAQGDGDEGPPQELSADNGRQVDVPVISAALELTAGAESEGVCACIHEVPLLIVSILRTLL